MTMHNDDLALINDEPFGIDEDEPATFLIRMKGNKVPFAAIIARDMEELFDLVDVQSNPRECECTVMQPGDALFFNPGSEMAASEDLEDRLPLKRAWRPVDDGSIRAEYEKNYRQFKIARLEAEAADLGEIFKGLKRKADDRFNGYRRRAREDAGALEEAGSGQDHPHGGARSHRVRADGAGHAQGRNRGGASPRRSASEGAAGVEKAQDHSGSAGGVKRRGRQRGVVATPMSPADRGAE